MKDERRNELMKTEEGRDELRTEMVDLIFECARDIVELHKRGAIVASASFSDLEDAENALLNLVGQADPGNLLQEIRQLAASRES